MDKNIDCGEKMTSIYLFN